MEKERTEELLAKTVTGKKVHLALGNVTPCGLWLDREVDFFFGERGQITCERCKQFLEDFEKDIKVE
jgi:hypothetical protein